MRLTHGAAMLAILALSACGAERDISMRDLRSFTGGPDEFMVLPAKPLQEPGNFSELPAPTPGGANLTDVNPKGDAVAALGGKASALNPTQGVPAGDGALVQYASRNGVQPDIRETLSKEDTDFRRRASRFTKIRIVRVDRYNEAYKREQLKPHQTLEAWRRAGAQTPSAPPIQ
ncbi:MAG: DUF3035 domain-containing protein [Paracoccaceae bacterium]